MKTKFFNSHEQNLWFTSDLHLMHENIIKYCNRPFCDRKEMDTTLVENWNSVISEKDVVFVTGDLIMDRSTKSWNYFIHKLNGFIWLIKGNHDHEKAIPISIYNKFDWIDGFLNIKVRDTEIDGNIQYITLCHYPMLSWYQSHHGSWQLFGHIHSGKLSTSMEVPQINPKLSCRQLDIGVDAHNFFPLHWTQIKEIITKQCLKK